MSEAGGKEVQKGRALLPNPLKAAMKSFAWTPLLSTLRSHEQGLFFKKKKKNILCPSSSYMQVKITEDAGTTEGMKS